MNVGNKLSTGSKQSPPLMLTLKMSYHWSNPLWEDFSYHELVDEEEPPIDPEFDDLAGGLK